AGISATRRKLNPYDLHNSSFRESGARRYRRARERMESVMGRLFGEFKIGQRFETPSRTITEADIVAFSGLTGDYNPVHTDEVFAAATDFGGRVAHGPMGIGIAFGLASRLDLIDGTVIALLGVTWNFKAPMRPGHTIRALIDVVETRDVSRADHGLLG